MPDVDLLIRTSNEFRISNFLLWQIAYAELHFTPVLWPDFNRQELFSALRVYQGRHRRFGAVATAEPTGADRRPSGRRGRTTWGGWGRCTSGPGSGPGWPGWWGSPRRGWTARWWWPMPVGSWWGWPRGGVRRHRLGRGRGRGPGAPPGRLGGALTEAIVAYLEDRGVATVLLHATALGRPVYERLGFVPETAYLTLTGPTLPRSARPRVRPGRTVDLEAVVALDGAATGEDRRRC